MALIRVFLIPPPTPGYCFGGGKLARFVEVDWFRNDEVHPGFDISMNTEEGRKNIENEVRRKNYFHDNAAFLVMSEDGVFTIGYTEEFMFRHRV